MANDYSMALSLIPTLGKLLNSMESKKDSYFDYDFKVIREAHDFLVKFKNNLGKNTDDDMKRMGRIVKFCTSHNSSFHVDYLDCLRNKIHRYFGSYLVPHDCDKSVTEKNRMLFYVDEAKSCEFLKSIKSYGDYHPGAKLVLSSEDRLFVAMIIRDKTGESLERISEAWKNNFLYIEREFVLYWNNRDYLHYLCSSIRYSLCEIDKRQADDNEQF